MIRVLFVCLGNICRSPTAEAVFRSVVDEAGLGHQVEAASAGTAAYHVGEGADPRSLAAARRRGYDLSGHSARQVAAGDFDQFDYVLAMDRENLRDLERLCGQRPGGVQARARLGMLLDFAPQLGFAGVPDPYYRAHDGFDVVIDIVEESSRGLLEHIRSNDLS